MTQEPLIFEFDDADEMALFIEKNKVALENFYFRRRMKEDHTKWIVEVFGKTNY